VVYIYNRYKVIQIDSMVEPKAIEGGTKKTKKTKGSSADEAKFRRGLPIATRKVCF